MTSDGGAISYERLRQEQHPRCIVCGQTIASGLGLRFQAVKLGVVEATFACELALQGYPEVLHGGVICSLLDGAMTNCLFSLGIVAVTGDLHVRFRAPVAARGLAKVRAWIEASSSPLHKLKAQLEQDGQIKATAKGKFMKKEASATRLSQGDAWR